jgi:uncharacterized protein (UPF0276 family)
MSGGTFHTRVSRIPFHGLGLSLDVYQPDIFEVTEALARQGLTCGYLELFKAAEAALARVRAALPDVHLPYHGEGLWMTQPDWTTAYQLDEELTLAAAHLRALGSHWMTHECAAKQMAGFSFGTYLPPLFTEASADVTAEHVSLVQEHLDRTAGETAPLLLLEMPPLTYFAVGAMPIPEFFRRVAERSGCGLVLDIGHLWTVYRYTRAWRRIPLSEFVSEFLDVFPLEQVVQIHVAGLAVHEKTAMHPIEPPLWIDAHGAPIPELLHDMLSQVLADRRLVNLKGMALEVDTKPVPLIVEEFRRFQERFGRAFVDSVASRAEGGPIQEARPSTPDRGDLLRRYRGYARMVSDEGMAPSADVEPAMLDLYRLSYLPHEILQWGGALADMFPQTCAQLAAAGVALERFVPYWYREPRAAERPYDFFLLKLALFTAFVREVLPAAADIVEREAEELGSAYRLACDQAAPCEPLAVTQP